VLYFPVDLGTLSRGNAKLIGYNDETLKKRKNVIKEALYSVAFLSVCFYANYMFPFSKLCMHKWSIILLLVRRMLKEK
jgi:hypothetical protein